MNDFFSKWANAFYSKEQFENIKRGFDINAEAVNCANKEIFDEMMQMKTSLPFSFYPWTRAYMKHYNKLLEKSKQTDET